MTSRLPSSAVLDTEYEKSKPSAWLVFWIASIAVFLVSLDGTVLFAAFSALRDSFPRTSAADLSWILNGYTVVYAAMIIPAGGLADVYGRKRVFLLGLSIFLLASALCGLSESVPWLIAARVLQAVGAALLTPSSLSIVLNVFPQSKRALVVSVWGAVGALAAAVGPSIGSFVVNYFGWPWAFYINLPVGAITLWFGLALLEESERSAVRRPIDIIGMSLLIFSIGAIALAIVQSEAPTWTNIELVCLGGIGLVTFIVFVLWARKVSHPLIDLSLFYNPTYRAANLAMLAFGTAFAMMFFAFFFYMSGVWHYSLPQAGLAITPGPLAVVPVAVITGRLAGRLGHRPFLIGGSLIYAAAGLWFLMVPGNEPAYLQQWLPGLLLSGIGVGMVLPSLSGAAVSRLPVEHYAVGSAVNQAVRQVGAVIGVALTVLMLGKSSYHHSDFVRLYSTHVGLALLTGFLCLGVNTRPSRAK